MAEPTSLRLKVGSPKQHYSQPHELALKSSSCVGLITKEFEEKFSNICYPENKQLYTNPDPGGWSFFQDFYSSGSRNSSYEAEKEESVYVHPSVKRSSSILSEESLALCTEILGNETGTHITDSSIFASFTLSSVSPPRDKKNFCQFSDDRKVISHDFPPPLTTIRGSESVQLRQHREDGRLILEAVKGPSSGNCLLAERVDGRLRLHLLREVEEDDGIEEEDEQVVEDEEDEDEEFDEDESSEYISEEGVDCYERKSFEAETGMEKFQRPSRCKEDGCENNRLIDWDTFWVAT